jgi:hypothetical protein
VSVVTEARRAGRSPWVGRIGRLGYVAKGLVYATIGLLAIQIPLGLGGQATDSNGALRSIAQQPLGEAMLLGLAVGLAAYALWRLAQAFLDRGGEGTGPAGLAKRAGHLGRAVVYGGTSFAAFALVAGLGAPEGDERKDTAMVLSWPLGRYLVAAVGIGFLGAGLLNGYRALTQDFRKRLREEQLGPNARRWAVAVGVLGHAARGAVFVLIGAFLVRAAIQFDAREAIGLDGALRTLAEQAYGEVLLTLTAAGILSYALYCLVRARYGEV